MSVLIRPSNNPQYFEIEEGSLLFFLQDGGNLPTKDKIPAPNVSFIHCSTMGWSNNYSVAIIMQN